jgi:hypothetical protein
MKEHERKEFEKLEELRKTIERSPLTQKIREEENLKILEERLLAAAQLREERASWNSIPEFSTEGLTD